jgi:hypothetical protein
MALYNEPRARSEHLVFQLSADFAMPQTLAQPSFPKALSHFRASRQPHLGVLHLLPLEILHMILSALDLSTLVTFRNVNRAAIRAVNFLPAYRLLMSPGSRVLRDIVMIGQGHQFTCAELSEKMSHTKCENHNCGLIPRPLKYGQGYYPGLYMFFPTRQQLCFSCIQKITSCLTVFHEFGLQRPRDPRYHKYGSSTNNPSAVVALRFEYPHQTVSASLSSDVIKDFLESNFPEGVFNAFYISRDDRDKLPHYPLCEKGYFYPGDRPEALVYARAAALLPKFGPNQFC